MTGETSEGPGRRRQEAGAYPIGVLTEAGAARGRGYFLWDPRVDACLSESRGNSKFRFYYETPTLYILEAKKARSWAEGASESRHKTF